MLLLSCRFVSGVYGTEGGGIEIKDCEQEAQELLRVSSEIVAPALCCIGTLLYRLSCGRKGRFTSRVQDAVSVDKQHLREAQVEVGSVYFSVPVYRSY